MKKISLFILVSVLLLVLVGCGVEKNEEVFEENPAENEESAEESGEEKPREVNVTGLEPNEEGEVMILMYHRIGDEESTWTRTRGNFRSDLELLYEKGYRLVSLSDYLDDNINIPLGTSPVILTFDDGSPGQFNFIETADGLEIDPHTAVGIMLDFHEENPDFGLEAIFYVNWRPFNSSYWQEALKEIVDLGMDIGNHTLTHMNLRNDPIERYPEQIGGLVAHVREAVPGYEMDSIALPFGAYPADVDKALHGEYEGVEYNNRALLLVGAHPAPSPKDPDFDPLRLPRVRADEENFMMWINHFDKNPEQRYVSAGKNE